MTEGKWRFLMFKNALTNRKLITFLSLKKSLPFLISSTLMEGKVIGAKCCSNSLSRKNIARLHVFLFSRLFILEFFATINSSFLYDFCSHDFFFPQFFDSSAIIQRHCLSVKKLKKYHGVLLQKKYLQGFIQTLLAAASFYRKTMAAASFSPRKRAAADKFQDQQGQNGRIKSNNRRRLYIHSTLAVAMIEA